MKKLFFSIFFSVFFSLFIFLFMGNFCFSQNALRPQLSTDEKNTEIQNSPNPLLNTPQKISQDEINPFSLRPISKSHIAFQKSIWLRVSFKEKANLPLWYAGHELSKFLIQSALEDKITAYTDDNLETVLTKNDLLQSLKLETQLETQWNENIQTAFQIELEATPKDSLLDFAELSILEIKEDYILDIQHSRMVHDVIAFTLILPHNATGNSLGMTKKVVSFSYKEIIEKLFRPLKEDYVILESSKSNGHIPNLETLIDSRFFHGFIVKYDNFKDQYLEEQYANPKKAASKSMQYAEKLIEFESNLWE